jgi:hypothetical protein
MSSMIFGLRSATPARPPAQSSRSPPAAAAKRLLSNARQSSGGLVPALPPSIHEPLWDQFAALLPHRDDAHPLGCHRPRIPERVVFDKLISLADQLRLLVLGAYDRLLGLELTRLAVDGCITKTLCGGQTAGPSPVDRAKQGGKRSVTVEADGIPLGAVAAPANRRDDGLLALPLQTLASLGPCPVTPSCTWTPATTGSQAVTSSPPAVLSVGSPTWPTRPNPGRPPLGHRADPRLGEQLRQAALVHRTPSESGRLLARAHPRHHHPGTAHPPPGPTTGGTAVPAAALTAYRRSL